jgi:hypothetical protein
LNNSRPSVVHVFSLFGLSKSLLFTLHNTRLPVVYDVFDHWLSANVREDPGCAFGTPLPCRCSANPPARLWK